MIHNIRPNKIDLLKTVSIALSGCPCRTSRLLPSNSTLLSFIYEINEINNNAEGVFRLEKYVLAQLINHLNLCQPLLYNAVARVLIDTSFIYFPCQKYTGNKLTYVAK